MTFVDRPLPAGLLLPAIAPPRRKPKFIPPPKQKGTLAKVTKDVKNGILGGAIAHGFDGSGLGGLEGYFQMCASLYPRDYLDLLAKLLPFQNNNNGGDGVVRPGVMLNIVSIPTGEFLSAEDCEKMRAPGLQVDQTPIKQVKLEHYAEPAPEIEPQAAENQRLLELSASIKDLARLVGAPIDDL